MKRIIGREIQPIDPNSVGRCGVEYVDPANLSAAIPYRFGWVLGAIQKMRDSGEVLESVLDVGAWNGQLTLLLAGIGLKVDAVETNIPAFLSMCKTVDAAKQLLGSVGGFNISFQEFSPGKKYDVIIMFEILEHVPDPLFCVEKAYDLLEIGGYLFITVPEEHGQYGLGDRNPNHYWTASVQSLVSVLFHVERKWRIYQIFEVGGLIHIGIRKLTYQE